MSETQRTREAFGGVAVKTVGLRPRPLSDVYHFLLVSRWWVLLLMIAAAFAALNAAFALAYLALGDAIVNARHGSFADAFFFSVQTMTTVGYGNLAPATLAANVLSAVEMIAGWIGFALMTGVVFSKFSRPKAQVLFSRLAVVRDWEGVPSLMFRMANTRASHIVEAHVHVMLVRNERTVAGEEMRRMHNLRLLRAESAMFALTWTAIHPIDGASALRDEDRRSLAQGEGTVVVSFTGYDENLATVVHARHAYRAEEILWDHRFVDVIQRGEDGERVLDYRRFHDVEPMPERRNASAGGPGLA